MKKIVVFGATGNTGKYLLEYLKENLDFILNDSNFIYRLKGMVRDNIFNGLLTLYNDYRGKYFN